MGWTRWNHKYCAQQGEEKHIHHPADTERYKLYQGHAEHGDVCSGLNHVHHRPIFWVGCGWKSVQGIPSGTIPVCEHHSSTRKFCWMRHWGQRQGRKLWLPLGKCHLWSLKGQNLGWHLVVTLARHSHLRSLRWPNSEAVSQSLFLQTFPINVADVSGWEANENSSSVHSWTSNSTLEGTRSRLIVWDVEHPNSSQGYRRRSTHLTKNELSHCLTGEF